MAYAKEWNYDLYADLILESQRHGLQVRGLNFVDSKREWSDIHQSGKVESGETVGDYYQAASVLEILRESPRAKIAVLSGLAHTSSIHPTEAYNQKIQGCLLREGLSSKQVMNFGIANKDSFLAWPCASGESRTYPHVRNGFLPLPVPVSLSASEQGGLVSRLNGIVFKSD